MDYCYEKNNIDSLSSKFCTNVEFVGLVGGGDSACFFYEELFRGIDEEEAVLEIREDIPKFHPEKAAYHVLDPSPWPINTSISLNLVALSLISIFHFLLYGVILTFITIPLFSYCLFFWFYDIILEGRFEGNHTKKVQSSLKLGIILFITSEVLFFFSFFWAYFHSALVPTIWIGELWPPSPIKALDPYALPMLNTVLLLSSGFSVTWAHRALLSSQRLEVVAGLVITVAYGLFFTAFQLIEYNSCDFSIADTVYGSSFFMLTGFHGLHVIIGTIMLIVSFWRHLLYHLDNLHHIGFEAAIWYWHFVDVVWLFLYFFVYILVF